jgi:hypothetical protein
LVPFLGLMFALLFMLGVFVYCKSKLKHVF